MKTDIILAGVGGQGILSIAAILGRAALNENLYIKQAEVHGMSQRGGDVQSNLRISDKPVASDLIPLGQSDLIISLEPMEALRYVEYLGPEGRIVTNTTPFVNIPNYPDLEAMIAALHGRHTVCHVGLPHLPICCIDLPHLHGRHNVVAFDVDKLAREKATPRASNMALLGAASPFVCLEAEKIRQAIADVFTPKGEEIIEMNIKAFNAGRKYTLNHSN